ncbi:MAG: site-specific integrase, partial [Oscillospiraceae bacterium]|nr:site-specific integrase [Oscillospiraceae bacterium]
IKEYAPDGRKKYGSVYARSYREVKAKQQLCVIQPSEHMKKSDVRIDELMQEWLNSNRYQIKVSSYQKYQTIVRNHISDKLGKLPVKCISAQLLTQFSDSLITEKHLSAETVNQILIVLGMGFKYAREHYQVTMPQIHFLKTSKANMRVLTPSEQQTLVKRLIEREDIFSFGILLALYTGLRVGEVCALRWEDISENSMHIGKTMQRLKNSSGKTEVMILSSKTASSDRVIPIPRLLLPIIGLWRKSHGNVLTQSNGSIIEPRLLQRKFSTIITECGLEKANFHALRHTFATRCIEAGVDVKTLSELLGHSDVKTTLNRYVHSSFELKQSSMDKLSFDI